MFEYQGRKMKFLGKPNEWLFCHSCHGIANHATQLSCCGKLFCKSCLQEIVGPSPGIHCPMCRKSKYQYFEDPRSNGIIANLKVMCPNGCSWQGELQKISIHLDSDNKTGGTPGGQGLFACPLQHISCVYRNIGCTARPQRKDMDQHMADAQHEHLELTMTLVAQMQLKTTQLEETVKKQTVRLAEHENRIRDSERMIVFLRQAIGVAPIIVTVDNIPQLNDINEKWFSAPFYTHLHGYRMQISIQFGKDYAGYSVYAHLLRGDYDDTLEWPFKGELKIEILNIEGQIVSEVVHTFSELQGKRIKEYGIKGDGEYIGDLYLTDGDDPNSRSLISDNCSFRVSFTLH